LGIIIYFLSKKDEDSTNYYFGYVLPKNVDEKSIDLLARLAKDYIARHVTEDLRGKCLLKKQLFPAEGDNRTLIFMVDVRTPLQKRPRLIDTLQAYMHGLLTRHYESARPLEGNVLYQHYKAHNAKG